MTAQEILTAIDAGVEKGIRIEDTVARLISEIHDAVPAGNTIAQLQAAVTASTAAVNAHAGAIAQLQADVAALQAPQGP